MVKSFSVGVSSSGFFLACQGCLGKRRDIPQSETGGDQTQLGIIIPRKSYQAMRGGYAGAFSRCDAPELYLAARPSSK
jgi:hypothetical protein